MIDRKEFIEELTLRENIRKAINLVVTQRNNRKLLEQKDEQYLRTIIQELILEAQSAVASVAKHSNTGINTLEDLLKGTNLLSVLETGYKSLTTTTQQRTSYMNHILNAVKKSLAPEESRKHAGEDAELNEDIDIEIGDRPEDDPDFIDVEDDGPVEEEEPDPKEEFGIEGEDKTGRNRAYDDFQDIEKVILTAFDNLDNPEDIAMFEEYLVKNLALYFEKFEDQLVTDEEAPPEAAEAVADEEADEAEGTDDAATGVPGFELQEVLRYLNVDDIVDNIL